MKPQKRIVSILAACGLAFLTSAQSGSALTTTGLMTNSETWSGKVTLTGDVTVPAGVTLTILPGTTVACWADYDDQAGGPDEGILRSHLYRLHARDLV